MTIPDKATFNDLSQRGCLGNFLRTFNTIEELEASGYRGWLTIQSRNKQSPHFVPSVTYRISHRGLHPCQETAAQAVLGLICNGAKREEMYFREIPPPDTNRIIQFEGMLGPTWPGAGAGVELFYELDTTLPVRGIRERCRTASGLEAQALLRTHLEPASYDTLMDLWNRYPTAVVEFTEFSAQVGAFHRRGVFWEIRNF